MFFVCPGNPQGLAPLTDTARITQQRVSSEPQSRYQKEMTKDVHSIPSQASQRLYSPLTRGFRLNTCMICLANHTTPPGTAPGQVCPGVRCRGVQVSPVSIEETASLQDCRFAACAIAKSARSDMHAARRLLRLDFDAIATQHPPRNDMIRGHTIVNRMQSEISISLL